MFYKDLKLIYKAFFNKVINYLKTNIYYKKMPISFRKSCVLRNN